MKQLFDDAARPMNIELPYIVEKRFESIRTIRFDRFYDDVRVEEFVFAIGLPPDSTSFPSKCLTARS